MTNTEDIRVVDFFESVMEHPHHYTINGSYVESIAFIEGCLIGILKLHLNRGFENNHFSRDIQNYQEFKEWLSKNFNSDTENVFKKIQHEHTDAIDRVLKLYRDFKAER